MLDNVDIRSALVAWLKANATIVDTLNDSLEIRELNWSGEVFTYPVIRVTCSSVPNQCDYSDVTATISYFSEQKSSKESLTGQGVIAKQVHKKSVDQGTVHFSNMRVTSLPDAVQAEKGVWKADTVLSFRASEV
jgi:hypothetical protein